MNAISTILLCIITLFTFSLVSSCGFDEGYVGRKNSEALRQAKKYWAIKNKTMVPLEKMEIETGSKVTYSLDGKTFKTVGIHTRLKSTL